MKPNFGSSKNSVTVLFRKFKFVSTGTPDRTGKYFYEYAVTKTENNKEVVESKNVAI